MQHAAHTTAARTPVETAIEQWQGFCQRYSPETRRSYQFIMQDFLDYVRPAVLRDITPVAIHTYVNYLLARVCRNTLNTRIAIIKSFCHWFSDLYGLPNPAAKIRKFPSDKGESRCLTEEEYHKCLAVTTGRDYHLIRFLANTALRIGEVESLTPASIRGNWLVVVGKRHKVRQIPLNPNAAESLAVIMKFSRSKHINYMHCVKIAARAGIPPFSPHSLRHYCITRLLSQGKPLHLVSKFAGHSSTVVTEKIYFHYIPEHPTGLTDGLD